MRKAILLLLLALPLFAADKPATKAADKATDKTAEKNEEKAPFAGLDLREIGPALTSGRIVDLAVDPKHPDTWFVASASGGVWKTTNRGTTFTPVFDHEGSYSIGCVTVDPNNSLVVWVGTGENNAQRSVSMGDGVYKSVDGGKDWKNVGLKSSEHVGKVLVDPRNSDVVYVAAQGPLWAAGGDRGLYKTTDGGKTWKAVLTISPNTGVTDVVFDASNPDILYAASYQRRRHVYTLIDGGPESAIYKSTDAGATWTKLDHKNGLPKEDMGRIGLAVGRKNPNIVYATIESTHKAGGFFRSTDGGANFKKVNDFVAQGQYYGEIFVDPNDDDRIYDVDVWVHVSDDGGKTFHEINHKNMHPDNHVVWIDPSNSDHLLIGNDGGLYETYDRATTWNFKPNLPVTQFYRIAADNALPFYSVYGGTQDNFSLGGPARTPDTQGISNEFWYVTQGGDGFRSVPDPKDADIIYAEAQNGALVRFDKKTGEAVDVQPQQTGTMEPLRFNWDSPIIVSPFDNHRLYFAAQYLFRSDDRGNTWKQVSPDLTRHIDVNTLPIMGRVWGIDAVSKNASTSWYGNIVSLAESPKQEGLIYSGSDDGLIEVTEDNGANWRKIDEVPGVPKMTYVSALYPSWSDANTVYAAFDNHKQGDFKPYLFKSSDRGRTWKSISGDLPQRGTVYAVVEDPGDANLLFAGTEYGLFYTQNGGAKWTQIKGKFPTIAVRDLWIQRQHDDLDVATFGRGFWVLDNYTPLRTAAADLAAHDVVLFPTRDAELYIQRSQLGLRGKSFQGDTYFTAANPPFGAVFTYSLKKAIDTKQKQRWESEAKIEKAGGNEPVRIPALDELRAETREIEPAMVLVVSDPDGNVVRRVTGPVTAGIHRVAWDLRYPSPEPVQIKPAEDSDPFEQAPPGPLAAPGKYSVRLFQRVNGVETPVGDAQTFSVVPLYASLMNTSDRAVVLDFSKKAARLQSAVMGASRATTDALTRVDYIRHALDQMQNVDPKLVAQVNAVNTSLLDIRDEIRGDPVLRAHNMPAPPSLMNRVETAVGVLGTTTAPTSTQREALDLATAEASKMLDRLRTVIETDLASIDRQLNAAGAPWTPGRVPTLQ